METIWGKAHNQESDEANLAGLEGLDCTIALDG